MIYRFPKCKHLLTAGSMWAATLLANAQSGGMVVPQVQFQQPSSSSATVSGRVICSDTQHPARFAQVNLIPADAASATPGRGGGGFGRGGSARTDLDGSFTVTNVEPGDYYVAASATGYISEMSLMMASGADLATALSHLPSVHVVANAPSTVNVSIERGGVVAGRIQWDDGTPAAGVQVNLQSANTQTGVTGGQRMGGMIGFVGGPMGGQFAQTDDRGQFRISGVAPGDYLLRSTVQAPFSGGGFGRTSAISLYAPGKVRRADAQVVSIRAGEERSDLSILLDLSTLHRVSGRVGAASGTVASGTVRLVDSQDSTLSRTATITPDGTYALSYVPAGTYTLSVPFASTTAPVIGPGRGFDGNGNGRGRSGGQGSSFQPFQETLTVTNTDLSDVNVTLMPSSSASSTTQISQ